MATPFNRRSFFGGMVGHALGASAVVSGEPIWGAIDGHARAYAALDEALSRQEELEREWLARSADRDEAELVGDPRWVVPQLELDVLDEAEAWAATELAQTEPSTAAGAVAMARHVASFRARRIF
jgi:hypothetical protein